MFHLATVEKILLQYELGLYVLTVHEQRFPLSHYCGIGDVPSVVASVTHTVW
jgi:hypothetical protein